MLLTMHTCMLFIFSTFYFRIEKYSHEIYEFCALLLYTHLTKNPCTKPKFYDDHQLQKSRQVDRLLLTSGDTNMLVEEYDTPMYVLSSMPSQMARLVSLQPNSDIADSVSPSLDSE